jgi:hypothetical protein
MVLDGMICLLKFEGKKDSVQLVDFRAAKLLQNRKAEGMRE